MNENEKKKKKNEKKRNINNHFIPLRVFNKKKETANAYITTNE